MPKSEQARELVKILSHKREKRLLPPRQHPGQEQKGRKHQIHPGTREQGLLLRPEGPELSQHQAPPFEGAQGPRLNLQAAGWGEEQQWVEAGGYREGL